MFAQMGAVLLQKWPMWCEHFNTLGDDLSVTQITWNRWHRFGCGYV